MSVPDAAGPRTPREALSAAPGAGTGAHAAPAVGPSDPSPAVPHAPRLAVVGNPDNRRVALFAQAVRAAGLALGRGGVGYYPGAGFVHLDTGPPRRW